PRRVRPLRPRPTRTTSSVPTRSRPSPTPAPLPLRNRTARRVWWDERKPGGAIRSLIFMGHPGPSLLVTGVLVAIAGLAERRVPDALLIVQLVGAMLPV